MKSNGEDKSVENGRSAVGRMRETALKLADEARATARIARESAEQLEQYAEQIGQKAVEVFDRLGHEANTRIERTAAAIKSVREHTEALTADVIEPEEPRRGDAQKALSRVDESYAAIEKAIKGES